MNYRELSGQFPNSRDMVPIRFLYEHIQYMLDLDTRILYDLKGNRVERAQVVTLEVDKAHDLAGGDFEFD